MTELYRLRSIDRLLGDSQELEKQAIYFASPEELNDPIEGFRNIVWQGDRIVWINLFRHYLYCLHMTYALFTIGKDSIKVKPQDIPVMSDMTQPTPEAINLFEDICGRVFKKTNLDEFIAKIVNAKRKAHHDEVLFYLQFLHCTALQEIRNEYVDRGLESNGERRETFPSVFSHVHEMLDLLPQIEDEKFLDVLFESSAQIMKDNLFRYKYIFKSESNNNVEANKHLLICDFPRAYLNQLEQLLYPNWYVACFMSDFRNSSVWGNYGDHHKGVCLIFQAGTTEGRSSLTLNQITGYSNNGESWGPSPTIFYEVNYEDKADEIDFFRSIGWFPEAKLKEVWYSDKDGNLSECGAHLGPNNIASWREGYWKKFYPDIIAKTRDWEYEQESRLILHSMLDDLSEPRKRTLTYDFRSLKGIIFGIRTPDSDKMKIIETIHKKCRENHRSDFEFFQAYHCHKKRSIQKHKLSLKFSV